MDNIRNSIIEIVEDILNTQHKAIEKKKLDTSKEMQLSMACPCCGDSKTNNSKKRGILYLDSYKYYCWNGDCNAKDWTIFKFFEKFNKKISNLQQVEEISKVIKTTKKVRKPTKLIESSSHFEFLYNNAISTEQLEKYYGLLNSKECSWGNTFLINRLLHNFSDRIRFRVNKFGNKEVWILNKINETDKVVGLQIKNLDYGTKYTTKTFNCLVEEMNINIDYPDDNIFIEKLSTLSIIFNIYNVDVEKDLTVFEGPLDSFFIPNSVATAGASKLKNFFDGLDNVRYWFDNDSTGKTNTISKIKTNNICFLWKKFFNESAIDNKKIKDLNELVMYIYNNKKYKTSLDNIKKSFSKNKYDIYYV